MQEIIFRNKEGGKEKYEVTIDQEKLLELMRRVATHCGELREKKIECKYGSIPHEGCFSFKNNIHITDVHTRLSGNKGTEWDHYDEYEVDLYYCDYKEYTCPPLVDFIDELAYGSKQAIDLLFSGDLRSISKFQRVKDKIPVVQEEIRKLSESYNKRRKKKVEELNKQYEGVDKKGEDIDKKIDSLQRMIKKAKEELLRMDKEYTDKMKELNDRLKDLLGIQELNRNQEPVINYLPELLSCVEYRLVDEIDEETLNRVSEFNKKEVTRDLGEKPKQFQIKKTRAN